MTSQAVQAAPAAAQAGGPLLNGQEVIQLVNQARANNGLAPYNVDGALMAAAAAHSQYQASIGSTSHTGSGGSSVTSRAIAAGYGGGAAVSVTENVYSGMNAGAQQAVTWWSNDATHLATLISTRYQDAGAGVASADGVVYITLVVGSVTGAAGSAETQTAWLAQATGESGETSAQTTAAPAADAAASAATSTPGADGSIIHEVASGQTLWSIAAMYKIGLADLLRINGLNDAAVIKPGQKIVIQPAGSLPTATFALQNAEGTPVETGAAPQAATQTRAPTRTPRPTHTETAQRMSGAASPQAGQDEQVGALQAPPAGSFRLFGLDPLLVVIGALVLGGIGLLAAGSLLNRGE